MSKPDRHELVGDNMSQIVEANERVKRLATEDVSVGVGLQDVLCSVDAELAQAGLKGTKDNRLIAMHAVVDEFFREFVK